MKPHRALSNPARSLLVVLPITLLIFGIALAADGALDTSFGSPYGMVANCVTLACHDAIYDIAIQPDGKVVGAGLVSAGAGGAFGMARYNLDGSLDTTFGSAGKVVTVVGAGSNQANDVAIQADGKIVVVGDAGSDFAVVRYNRDGSLDTGFGASGFVKTSLSPGFDMAWGLAIASDAKIVVVGSAFVSSHTVYAVVRYNPDGSLDPGFNGTGILIDSNPTTDSAFYSAAIQPDGKILCGGSKYSVPAFMLVRFNANGSLDTTGFGSPSGFVLPPMPGAASILGLSIQPDGKILAVGDGHGTPGIPGSYLARFNLDGSLDTANFASPAGYAASHCGAYDEFARGLALQADGKILVSGFFNSSGSSDPTLRRYNADGSLDASFGSACTSLGLSGGFDGAALTPDGKFLTGGGIGGPASGQFFLARYLTGSTSVVSKAGAGDVAPSLIEPANLMVQFNPGHACTSGVITVTKTLGFPDDPAQAGGLPMTWQISTDCPAEYSLKLSLCYTGDEMAKAQTLGAVSEDNLELYKFSGGSWVRQGGVVDAALSCVTLYGVSALSDWTLRDVTFDSPTQVRLSSLAARSQAGGSSAGLALTLGGLLVLAISGIILGWKRT